MIYQINLIQKVGDYFKRNNKTGFAAPISIQPIEQRATTRGTGISLAEIQEVCFILVHDSYDDTVRRSVPPDRWT